MRSTSSSLTVLRFRTPLWLAVVALFAMTFGQFGIKPAHAANEEPTRLAVTAVVDQGTGIARPVKDKPFNVTVRSLDASGTPIAVKKATTVALSVVVGTGMLSGTTTAVIPRAQSTVTVTGALYSVFENGVVFRVSSISGVVLSPDETTANVQALAVATSATPRTATTLTNNDCSDTTPSVPTCATLRLPNGANGSVSIAQGSCGDIVACRGSGTSEALLVEALANLKDAQGNPLYSRSNPATLIVQCDKSLCGNGGVTDFPLLVDILGDGSFVQSPACPSKGQISPDPISLPFCLDYRASSRDNAGDLLSYLLFSIDVRASHP